MCLVILYVDDLLITGSFEAKIEQLLNELKSTFEMTNLGLLHYFLDMESHFSGSIGIFDNLKPMARLIAASILSSGSANQAFL